MGGSAEPAGGGCGEGCLWEVGGRRAGTAGPGSPGLGQGERAARAKVRAAKEHALAQILL